MAERVYNFSAGPAVLPLTVLERAANELLALPGVGASVMEISHRSKPFEEILNATEQNIRKLLGVPDNYRVLFLQGGAMLQFAMIPMNLARTAGASVDYLVTGSWSKKAISEAKTQLALTGGTCRAAWDGKAVSYKRKPSETEWSSAADAAYCYFCSNETIEGICWQTEPIVSGNVPLICDASSDIFSRPIDITKYAMIYACAQKNVGPAGVTLVIIRDDLVARSASLADVIPSPLNYKLISEAGSMLNTPPTFAIYMVRLVTDWLLNDVGGLEKMYAINKEKAAWLYDAIDSSSGFYTGHAEKAFRSLMNVPFRLPSETLEKQFQDAAKQHNLTTLAGHRSVGGLRASIYNAMPRDGVKALATFMTDFAKRNG